MNAIVTLIIGITAARAARSTFPGSRYFGFAGTMTLGIAGAVIGSVVGLTQLGAAEHWAGFSAMNIWWSTLGSVILLAVGIVARRSDLAFESRRKGPGSEGA